MKLYVKNMVCPRCITAVNKIFTDLGFNVEKVELGEVIISQDLNEKQLHIVNFDLEKQGFKLLDDFRKQQVEKIKSIIIQYIHHMDGNNDKFSEVLAQELNKEYSQLSKLFSNTEGITIEQFFINQKIERVKELLLYDEMSLGEIAYKLGYSSIAHLSTQFKKVIGLTSSQFKLEGGSLRKSLDEL